MDWDNQFIWNFRLRILEKNKVYCKGARVLRVFKYNIDILCLRTLRLRGKIFRLIVLFLRS
jgi:hypothetical protein